MSDTEGTVTGLDGDHAWVAVRRASACGNCDGACASGLMAEAMGPKMYRVPNTDHACVGDVVSLSAPAGAVFRAALLSYLLPVGLALGGALAGNLLAGDGGAVGGVLGGLLLAVPFLHRLGRPGGGEPGLSLRVKRHVISLPRKTGS